MWKTLLGFLLSGVLALSVWAVSLAAPAPQDRPGIVTQPKVTIQNRGRNEAVPVSVQEWLHDRPVSVQVTGTATVEARRLSQPWLYRTVRVPAGQDLSAALTVPGNDGWEVTGIQTTDASGTNLLLKRPAR